MDAILSCLSAASGNIQVQLFPRWIQTPFQLIYYDEVGDQEEMRAEGAVPVL